MVVGLLEDLSCRGHGCCGGERRRKSQRRGGLKLRHCGIAKVVVVMEMRGHGWFRTFDFKLRHSAGLVSHHHLPIDLSLPLPPCHHFPPLAPKLPDPIHTQVGHAWPGFRLAAWSYCVMLLVSFLTVSTPLVGIRMMF